MLVGLIQIEVTAHAAARLLERGLVVPSQLRAGQVTIVENGPDRAVVKLGVDQMLILGHKVKNVWELVTSFRTK